MFMAQIFIPALLLSEREGEKRSVVQRKFLILEIFSA
jgi:hypothetical protein